MKELDCICLDHIMQDCPYHSALRIVTNKTNSVNKEKADGNGWGWRCRKFYKNIKNRSERRKAKKNPECSDSYGRYKGWLT